MRRKNEKPSSKLWVLGSNPNRITKAVNLFIMN